MSLLMVGSFPLLMSMVLMLAVWMERLLDRSEDLVLVDNRSDAQPEVLSPQPGMAVPTAPAAMANKPEL